MNIREGARRIRLIAMWLIGLGIAMIVINLVVITMSARSVGVLDWMFFIVPGFGLALVAWVVEGFGAPEKQDSGQRDGL